jgi:outer membrane protein OmpA-like peptidoglycan-associated protein
MSSYRLSVLIKDYFGGMGVDSNRIEVTGHGEKRHISPNDNAIEREQNRRVVIRMSKSTYACNTFERVNI